MSDARPVTISIAQFNAQDDEKPGNLAKAQHYLDLAGTRGSNIVVLPELFTGTGFSSGTAHQMLAEPIPGPTLAMMAAAARKHAMYVTGSFYEKGADGRIYNTAPVIGPGGDLLGCYRKTHLFDVPNRTDLPPGIMESSKVTPGKELQLYDTNLCRFGLGICADIRFPEMFRAYAKAGAELILLPTAFLSPRFDHWDFLLKARATDHQMFIAASGMTGKEKVTGIGFIGRSSVVDPWGVILAGAPDEEAMLTTTIDLDQVRRVRNWWPLNDQTRPDLYGQVAVKTTRP
ncbi:carbon-nitrogen hydrolase family protein [Dongia sp.]|uniref:carbon-nitrogen hydrolase family protein n=1 Tax=Dongia sp. TaxID=1977262 RepID=UPI0035B09D2F